MRQPRLNQTRRDDLAFAAMLVCCLLALLAAAVDHAGASPLRQETATPTPTAMPTETATPTITPTPTPDTLLYSTLDPSGQAVAVRMEVTAGDLALVFLGLVQLTLLVVAFVVAVVRGRV